jgi:hypothetical protein
MQRLIDQHLPELIIITIIAIALIAFLIYRNNKDEKPFERDEDENI